MDAPSIKPEDFGSVLADVRKCFLTTGRTKRLEWRKKQLQVGGNSVVWQMSVGLIRRSFQNRA